MDQVRSFKDYIAQHFENQIFDAISEYIEQHTDALDCHSNRVNDIDEANLSGITIRSVKIHDAGDDALDFDVIAETEIEISGFHSHHDLESDDVSQWFCISCRATLKNGLHGFQINNVAIYNKGRTPQNSLSDELIPIIHTYELDSLADEFLRKYYPEALSAPARVDPLVVASRMGLIVQPAHLSKNCTIFGQIFFADCDTELYDENDDFYKTLTVKRGTILYDPNVFFMRNIGCINNTIIHECVHWDKHKKVFELEHLYNDTASHIKCRVIESVNKEVKRTPTEWMEWHANALAPRILMPRKQAYIKANELIQIHLRLNDAHRIADVIEDVISDMAVFFGVSKLAAKIRMVDMGFNDAMGAYTYLDEHYVRPHFFAKGALKKNQTFSIGVQDALFEYASNMQLRKMIDSGRYLYVDSHYCINDPKYIQTDENGRTELTEYARYHADECCLVFDLEMRSNPNYGAKYYTECILFRNIASNAYVEAKYQHSEQNQAVDAKKQQFINSIESLSNIQRKLPATFSGTLIAHMERVGITEEVLAERVAVDPKTIQRYRTDSSAAPSLKKVVAMCVVLHLPPILSYDFVRKSGRTFMPGNPTHIAYQLLLNAHYMNSLCECNELLEASDLDPLTK